MCKALWGFIPARVGVGCGGCLPGSCLPVYPRARGGKRSNLERNAATVGLSPCARERGRWPPPRFGRNRFIPARAGGGQRFKSVRAPSWVYPRARGGGAGGLTRDGASGVYPRARGGRWTLKTEDRLSSGLSSRARGEVIPDTSSSMRTGFILACAGRGPLCDGASGFKTVYPCAWGRGVHRRVQAVYPRVQMRAFQVRQVGQDDWFIPARGLRDVVPSDSVWSIRLASCVWSLVAAAPAFSLRWKAGAAARRAKDPPVPTAASPVYPRAWERVPHVAFRGGVIGLSPCKKKACADVRESRRLSVDDLGLFGRLPSFCEHGHGKRFGTVHGRAVRMLHSSTLCGGLSPCAGVFIPAIRC